MSWKELFLSHFPTPAFLEMPFVGIDISPSSMRLVEIKYGVHLEVGVFVEHIFAQPFSIDGDVSEAKNILSEWKKTYKLQYIKASLPEERAYLFQKEMVFDTDARMRQAIEIVLEENVPLNGVDSIFDYRLSGSLANEKVQVSVTALPRAVVQSYTSLFEECGLTPVSYMIEAQALSRAVVKRGDKETYLIVSMHQSRVGFFITSQEAVQFTSTVSCQPTDKKDILISDQIKKVFAYWHSKEGRDTAWKPIQKVVLCGKEAVANGLADGLMRDFVMPVEVADVWVNLHAHEGYVPPIMREDSLAYGAAIGLALPENE